MIKKNANDSPNFNAVIWKLHCFLTVCLALLFPMGWYVHHHSNSPSTRRHSALSHWLAESLKGTVCLSIISCTSFFLHKSKTRVEIKEDFQINLPSSNMLDFVINYFWETGDFLYSTITSHTLIQKGQIQMV